MNIRGTLLIVLVELLPFTTDFDLRATNQNPGSSGQDSAILKRMFQEDQAERNVDDRAMTDQQRSEWAKRLRIRDEQRRREAMDLIKRGELHTGTDFEEASVIFQHSLDANDYLFAHTLAVIAVAKGRSQSRWLVAATLDRYLHGMNQPQIYGTESLGTPYKSGPKTAYNWTQDPYNRVLIPDSLRAELCVPDLAQQQHALELSNEGKDSPERTNGPGCL